MRTTQRKRHIDVGNVAVSCALSVKGWRHEGLVIIVYWNFFHWKTKYATKILCMGEDMRGMRLSFFETFSIGKLSMPQKYCAWVWNRCLSTAPIVATNSWMETLWNWIRNHQNEEPCHDERQFNCFHCGKKFTNRDPLKVHHNHHQNETPCRDEQPLSCSHCGKTFISFRKIGRTRVFTLCPPCW